MKGMSFGNSPMKQDKKFTKKVRTLSEERYDADARAEDGRHIMQTIYDHEDARGEWNKENMKMHRAKQKTSFIGRKI